MGGPSGEIDRKKLLETFDGMSKALDGRANELADAHHGLEKNLGILETRMAKASVDRNAKTSEALQNAMLAVFGRLESLREEMETVSAEIDAVDEQYLTVNALPPPINE